MSKGKYLAPKSARRQRPVRREERRRPPVQEEVIPEEENFTAAPVAEPIPEPAPAEQFTAPAEQIPEQPAEEPAPRRAPKKKAKKKKQSFGTTLLHGLAVFGTVLLFIVLALAVSIKMICGATSPAAKKNFVTTMLETGQLKFLVSWFVPADEVQAIVDSNSMEKFDEEIKGDLISISDFGEDPDPEAKDIDVFEISGSTYTAKVIKVRDPSRISLATIYPWKDVGVTLEALVQQSGAVAAINGGIYNSTNNSGGRPYGIIVSNGQIQHNQPSEWPGLVLIGFDSNNILQIIDVNGMTPSQAEAMIKEKGIRDAVTFQEESSDANNHFVQLILNGTARTMNGKGSGLNPRTAIGQCADGSILLVVTDGRGKNGHLGASAADLIEIMTQCGAVNAANLDGGSSSCMYYNNEYLMTSVTFYYSNSSWKLPAAFVVK